MQSFLAHCSWNVPTSLTARLIPFLWHKNLKSKGEIIIIKRRFRPILKQKRKEEAGERLYTNQLNASQQTFNWVRCLCCQSQVTFNTLGKTSHPCLLTHAKMFERQRQPPQKENISLKARETEKELLWKWTTRFISHTGIKKTTHKYTNSMFYFYLVTENICDWFENKSNTNKKYR